MSQVTSGMGGTAVDVARGAGFVDRGAPLPEGYGETRITLMARDPQWMFTYWEVSEQTAREIKARYGEEIFRQAQATLRMHEVKADGGAQMSGVSQLASLRFVDVAIVLDTGDWYLRADRENSAWFVELGLKTADGNFILLAKSNAIRLPAGRVSDKLDEKWVSIKEDLEKILQMSGGGKVGMGSLELARMLSQRWEMLSQISSWRGSGGISSLGGRAEIVQEKQRGFWMMADCELVLYGATESSATVTVAGMPVELNPDGTFSLRFALPDGKLNLPVKAVSGDKVEEREIKISVERKTEK